MSYRFTIRVTPVSGVTPVSVSARNPPKSTEEFPSRHTKTTLTFDEVPFEYSCGTCSGSVLVLCTCSVPYLKDSREKAVETV